MRKMFSLILGLSVFGLSAVPSAFAGRGRKFTKEEDQQILLHVQEHGSNKWDLIAAQLGRDAGSCRGRYHGYLKSSDEEKADWSSDDYKLLKEKVREFGPKWFKIVRFFPGYTRGEIRKMWRRILRRGDGQFEVAPPVATIVDESDGDLTVGAAPIAPNTNGSSVGLTVAAAPVVPNTDNPYNDLYSINFFLLNPYFLLNP